MRFDKECQLSVAQAFTASAVSTNSYDKKTAAQDLSIGSLMALSVWAAVAASGGASWKLDAIQADDAALTSNVEVIGTITVADADLVKGNELTIPIRQGAMTKRYLGFRAAPTGGSSPGVTLDVYLMPLDEIPVKHKGFPKVVGSDA
jgi:hypothetical protein